MLQVEKGHDAKVPITALCSHGPKPTFPTPPITLPSVYQGQKHASKQSIHCPSEESRTETLHSPALALQSGRLDSSPKQHGPHQLAIMTPCGTEGTRELREAWSEWQAGHGGERPGQGIVQGSENPMSVGIEAGDGQHRLEGTGERMMELEARVERRPGDTRPSG